jgi:hypothetical protein
MPRSFIFTPCFGQLAIQLGTEVVSFAFPDLPSPLPRIHFGWHSGEHVTLIGRLHFIRTPVDWRARRDATALASQ